MDMIHVKKLKVGGEVVPFPVEVDVVGPRGPRAAARGRHAAYRLAPTTNRRGASPSSPSSTRTAMSFQNKSDGPIPLHMDVYQLSF